MLLHLSVKEKDKGAKRKKKGGTARGTPGAA